MASSALNSPPIPPPTAAKPRRRWYQFTLRTAGVWIALFCLLLGCFAWWRDRAERQRKVVVELRALGVIVDYRYFSLTKSQKLDEDYYKVKLSDEFFLCTWLRECLGDDFVDDVDSLTIRPDTSDTALPLVRKCPHVTQLALEGPTVSGAALQDLPCIERLEYLSLSHAYSRSIQFFDDDLAVLERATSLQWLDLRGQPIGDAGLEHLRNCRRLHLLLLGETKVSDKGLRHLSELRELECLDLSDTLVTDLGLKHLRKLNQLTTLNLHGDAITGEGLSHVGPKPKLRELYLSGTEFTDDALRHLTQFPQLDFFYLSETRVTGSGISHLAHHRGSKAEADYYWGISLEGCPVTDVSVAEIKIPNGCKRIFLDGTRITDKGFCKLNLPGSIDFVGLSNTAVTDASLDHLHSLANLLLSKLPIRKQPQRALNGSEPCTRIAR